MPYPFSQAQMPPPPADDFDQYDQQDGYGQPYDQMPPLQGGSTLPYPNQSAQLIQWILGFKREVIEPLKHMWRGEEQDVDGNWVVPSEGLHPIMNEKGISYCISLILSYCNPVFMTSNLGEDDLNYRMKEAGHAVINAICIQYRDFGMSKPSIQRVVEEINSKIHAIYMGARNNGYRMWMSSTHHSQEVVSTMPERREGANSLLQLKNFFSR